MNNGDVLRALESVEASLYGSEYPDHSDLAVVLFCLRRHLEEAGLKSAWTDAEEDR